MFVDDLRDASMGEVAKLADEDGAAQLSTAYMLQHSAYAAARDLLLCI